MLSIVTGLPMVVTLRGNETMHANYPVRRWLMTWMLGRASLVITLSRRLRDFAISAGVPPEKVVVIPNGIDQEIFYPREKYQVRCRLGIPGESRVIISVGSLIERKGHHRIIAAAAELRRQGIPVVVLIAGGAGREGDFHDVLTRQASNCNDPEMVRFMGLLSPTELAELMSAADVFCLASTREGWPNVVHEALACGTPVVATDVGAVPEMLPDDRLGIVVPPNDPDALLVALRQSLEKDWDHAHISRFGQSRGWDQVAREVLFGMHTVLNKNGGAWAAQSAQR
jgi:glycosyltransferase involved in cell wall biosynthesis